MSDEKKVISRILTQPREWFDVSEKLPQKGKPVVIRIANNSMNFGTNEDGAILAAEDSKIGVFMDNKWIVAPPYPKYDYSPLSSGPFLNEGSVVTHWAVPVPDTNDDIGELKAWESRFNLIGTYNKLKIDADKATEELLYRACSWGAAGIRAIVGNSDDTDAEKIITILYDIQALIDQDAEIRDGKIIKADKEELHDSREE